MVWVFEMSAQDEIIKALILLLFYSPSPLLIYYFGHLALILQSKTMPIKLSPLVSL